MLLYTAASLTYRGFCSLNVFLTLQRHFQALPFFELRESAFAVGFVGAMITLLVIKNEIQNISELALWVRQTPLQQCANLG
jgi:hypothetical protein